jgi:RHS repeat-associated protein
LPFGDIYSGGTSERYTYTGKEEDSTGLEYFGARSRNPERVVWTQPDSTIQDIYDPQGLNRYSYVKNNPYKYTDPDGNAPTAVYLGAGVIGFASGTVYYGVTHMGDVSSGRATMAEHLAKGIGFGAVSATAAVGGVFVVENGGRVASTAGGKGLLLGTGKFMLGVTEYMADQAIEGKDINYMDALVAGGSSIPDLFNLWPGSPYGSKNVFSSNNLKYYGNQLYSQSLNWLWDAAKYISSTSKKGDYSDMTLSETTSNNVRRSFAHSKKSNSGVLKETTKTGEEKVYQGQVTKMGGKDFFIGVRSVG